MLCLGNVLLSYVLIYNLEVSCNFHLTFLQLNVIKMFFPLLPAIFFELPITRTPDNSNHFRFPLKVRVIGSRLYFYRHTQRKLLRRRERKLDWQDWVCWSNPSERFNISNEAGGLICWSMTTRVAYIELVIITSKISELMRLVWYRRSHDTWAHVPYAYMRSKKEGRRKKKQTIYQRDETFKKCEQIKVYGK